ncbi:MAG TPA: bifunctional nuclease family protein [Planctomycetota bacterium]|nr:bifunctional nuclease family protein [Planctomycetota bacterium]
MLEVRIHSIAATQGGACIVLLEEKDGGRVLPIVCGMAEGQALALCASGFEPPRPMTHDLLVSVVDALGGLVLRVVVTEVKDDTFYARLHVERADGEVSIDARPSDALNIAVRSGVPIFVEEGVFTAVQGGRGPITEDEIERFRRELETKSASEMFGELEDRPGG